MGFLGWIVWGIAKTTLKGLGWLVLVFSACFLIFKMLGGM